jgi:hypothetical protein
MFVLEAVTLTFITNPLVSAIYPSHLRGRVPGAGRNGTNVANIEGAMSETRWGGGDDADRPQKTRFTVVLDKIEHLPGMMALTQLIRPTAPKDADSMKVGSSKKTASNESNIFIDALRWAPQP